METNNQISSKNVTIEFAEIESIKYEDNSPDPCVVDGTVYKDFSSKEKRLRAVLFNSVNDETFKTRFILKFLCNNGTKNINVLINVCYNNNGLRISKNPSKDLITSFNVSLNDWNLTPNKEGKVQVQVFNYNENYLSKETILEKFKKVIENQYDDYKCYTAEELEIILENIGFIPKDATPDQTNGGVILGFAYP